MRKPVLCFDFFIEAACVHLNSYVQNKRQTVCQTDKKEGTLLLNIFHIQKICFIQNRFIISRFAAVVSGTELIKKKKCIFLS